MLNNKTKNNKFTNYDSTLQQFLALSLIVDDIAETRDIKQIPHVMLISDTSLKRCK